MKKQSVILLVLLLTTSCIFFSCSNNMNKHENDFVFDSTQVNQTIHLFGDTSKPACNLIIDFAYAKNPNDSACIMSDSLNAFLIAGCLGDEYIGLTPENAIKQYAEQYIKDYRQLEPLFEKDMEENKGEAPAWYSYYRHVGGHVQLYSSELMVYRMDFNEYTGGAHGNYMTFFLNLDLTNMVPLYLDDIFATEYEEPLTTLLWEQLMSDLNVSTRQEAEDLGYGSTGELAPTNNFYLDAKGITFYYNIYEIAPYVMGPTKITLPYDRIEHLLGDRNDIIAHLR